MTDPTPAKPYKITASPGLRSITVGSRVRYALVGGPGERGKTPVYDEIFWFWQAERDFDNHVQLNAHKMRSTHTMGNRSTLEIDYLEPYANTDLVVWAAVRNGAQVTAVEPVRQRVDYVEVALAHEITAAVKEALPNPWLIRSETLKYAKVLRLVAQHAPPPNAAAFEEHHRKLRRLDLLANKLVDLFQGTFYLRIHKLNAVYIEKQSQEKKRLRVSLVKTGEKGGTSTWKLIDWTDPNDERLSGTHVASGPSDGVAIQRAIDAWNNKSKYPPGHIRYLIPQEISQGIDERMDGFEVGERGFWGTVADFLGIIATATALFAAVVSFMVPVPGSQLVSAALWTSVFASSAAAVINITTQDRTWKEDALDGLTIVGNLFTAVGAGARLWSRGRAIDIRDQAGKVAHYALIGQISADSINAVVIGYDFAVDLEKVMADPNMSPSERVQRLLQIMGRGAVQAVSIRGTKEDLKNLTLPDGSGIRGIDRLESLKDPKAEPLDVGPRHNVAGSTDQPGGSTTRVQHDPRRPLRGGSGPKPPPKPKTKWPAPAPAETRGMRGFDSLHFGMAASGGKDKYFIVVRDGNPDGVQYIGRAGHEGKPETMKAKTAQEGPYKGLVCFDPSHARTHDMIADAVSKTKPGTGEVVVVFEKIPKDKLLGGRSVAENMADANSEFRKRYDYIKEHKIEEMGFRVLPDDNYVVVHKGTGARYHGDYDLHGVYKPDGSFVADTTAIRNDLNERFKAKLIQHGAHDEWPDRQNPAKAGQNAGPQPPITIYTPDGTVYSISGGSLSDMRERMKQFYKERNMEWRYNEWEALPDNKIDTR